MTAPALATPRLPLLRQTGTQVLEKLTTKLGVTEGPRNESFAGAWYGLDHNPWCAMGASWAIAESGDPLPIQTPKGFAWCPAGVEFFQRAGAWLPASAIPPAGALVFFDWSPNDGLHVAEHVGIAGQLGAGGVLLLTDRAGNILTTECNTSNPQAGAPDGVFHKTRNRAGIMGFGLPRYGGAVVQAVLPSPTYSTPPRVAPAPVPRTGLFPPARPAPVLMWQRDGFTHPTIRLGAGGAGRGASRDVLHAQRLLIRSGRNLVGDGAFGPYTDQATRTFQHLRGLVADGVIGPLTWAALHRPATA